MHVGSDITNTVAFIGYEDSTAPGGIRCIGTGVLIFHKGFGYIVTARHVAEPIEDAPFLVRVNRAKGGCNVVRAENVNWQFHADPLVDLAAMPFHASPGAGFECLFIVENDIVTHEEAERVRFDIGDICYTVGLFRYMSGADRNEPVMFTGNIALWDGTDIPIWDKTKKRKQTVSGHIVQSHGLQGASGSPVFARSSIRVQKLIADGTDVILVANKIRLIGVMQGAWFLPPDEMLRAEIGANVGDTVPVGLGIITPSPRILELLEHNKEFRKMRENNPPSEAAMMTGLPFEKPAPEAKAANPQHQEDFKSLLSAAARKPTQAE